ncbi:ABC transporter ATP-binding protein [Rouxiella badensis]|jgi:peptide/nickel transport system ATP-binding protein|uniref:ABC transporter ATP-binding protein n=1 Tax=Rouxiella badensis TaxID=1646377 RepID=UPI0013EF2780|nr:ABC transporter ATP-binding protein [Rouxiella badensis]MCC3702013.1 ABC transporter ATP-binding protein [Rouxiella badensis]MCC3718171.1 ABC transporter ATP-binding protein [Rouxiella badensis]MCC3727061.1 ABC transporter ATP-binding protein [Rouxiella badensis]MCC3731655.1 ABC transporter ATP-binding protein [Rouxiella badensis]MCC3738590.1 ABC transporter ATP-binding protein [Rouxiella badensis]
MAINSTTPQAAGADSNLLIAKDLTVYVPGPQPIELVKSISFSVGQERVALVGESGSGKSMTARALMGLLPSPCQMQASQLTLGGQDLTRLKEREWNPLRGNRIAMVMQDPKHALNPAQAIGKQVEEPLRLHGRFSRSERKEQRLDMLNAVGLPNPAQLSKLYPHQLSGGMGQRVMLAIALINRPQWLVADEPTSALDYEMREQVLKLIERLVDERNMGLVLISHDLQQVSQYTEQVMVMYKGQIVDRLASSQLAQATHPYTHTLWSCRPSKATRGEMLPVLDRALLARLSGEEGQP